MTQWSMSKKTSAIFLSPSINSREKFTATNTRSHLILDRTAYQEIAAEAFRCLTFPRIHKAFRAVHLQCRSTEARYANLPRKERVSFTRVRLEIAQVDALEQKSH